MRLSNTGTAKSEWRGGGSRAACSNGMGYVCPAVPSAAAEKQVSGWTLSCVRSVRSLPAPLQTGTTQWLCPVASQTSPTSLKVRPRLLHFIKSPTSTAVFREGNNMFIWVEKCDIAYNRWNGCTLWINAVTGRRMLLLPTAQRLT